MEEVLPVIPSTIQRTSCACPDCAAGCKSMPGCLIPGDLEKIQEFVGDHSGEFILNNFLASPGPTALRIDNGVVTKLSCPTIVPAQREDGSCVFLDENSLCRIHEVSPFGCGYCDDHMSDAQADMRSKFAVTAQLNSHKVGARYSQVWLLLHSLGLVATPLRERKAAMQQKMEGRT